MGVLIAVHGCVVLARTTLLEDTVIATGNVFDAWALFVFLAAASIQVINCYEGFLCAVTLKKVIQHV
jgi:hypothetical protein